MEYKMRKTKLNTLTTKLNGNAYCLKQFDVSEFSVFYVTQFFSVLLLNFSVFASVYAFFKQLLRTCATIINKKKMFNPPPGALLENFTAPRCFFLFDAYLDF